MRRLANTLLALIAITAAVAIVAIGAALYNLHLADAGVERESISADGVPVTIYRSPGQRKGPVVVIAHGFAGSQQLMQSFATTFARGGYIAVTFDFAGHGRNPVPLTGSITHEDGATRTLVDETARVAAFARKLGDGRLAILGHSMASDIVIRFAMATPEVAATIAVSMFSPVVTATSPRNLLVIVGGWENILQQEALRVVGLAIAPAPVQPGVTYGDAGQGSARRAAFSPGVEHVGVLYSRASMAEALAWLDQSFGIVRPPDPYLDRRGPWIMLLLAGVVLLCRPLAALLPPVAATPIGAGLPWRRIWLPIVIPAIATPLLLLVLPTHFLPILVGDYLAVHFAAYGVITFACLLLARRGSLPLPGQGYSPRAFVATVLVVTLVLWIGFVWPVDRYVTSFVPTSARIPLILATLVGTLLFFTADEWLTRGIGAARWSYLVSKLAFVLSLAIAVGLDFGRLFFLIIIVPVVAVFFLVFGLLSGWVYRTTGHPLVMGVVNALLFAWAIGCTFPLLAG